MMASLRGAMPVGTEKRYFHSHEVREIVGITRRQMQYWDQTGLLTPAERTLGGHARYTFEDLIAYKTAKKLLDAGVSLQRIRKVMARLREILPTIKKPLVELTLVATGDVVLVFYENTAFEAITGQEWLLDVADVQRDVDRWQNRVAGIRRFRRGSRPETEPASQDEASEALARRRLK
ncbi:MAG: MerR family transcriptional regulator [Nitrospiria bacterium]